MVRLFGYTWLNSNLPIAQLGRKMRIIEISEMATGVALALLGLLDIGDTRLEFDINADVLPQINPPPIYTLLITNWALPLIALTYGVLCILQKVSNALHSRGT